MAKASLSEVCRGSLGRVLSVENCWLFRQSGAELVHGHWVEAGQGGVGVWETHSASAVVGQGVGVVNKSVEWRLEVGLRLCVG